MFQQLHRRHHVRSFDFALLCLNPSLFCPCARPSIRTSRTLKIISINTLNKLVCVYVYIYIYIYIHTYMTYIYIYIYIYIPPTELRPGALSLQHQLRVATGLADQPG